MVGPVEQNRLDVDDRESERPLPIASTQPASTEEKYCFGTEPPWTCSEN